MSNVHILLIKLHLLNVRHNMWYKEIKISLIYVCMYMKKKKKIKETSHLYS